MLSFSTFSAPIRTSPYARRDSRRTQPKDAAHDGSIDYARRVGGAGGRTGRRRRGHGDPWRGRAPRSPSGEITFIDQPERLKQLASTQAAAVVVPEGVDWNWPATIRVADVHAAFAKIVSHFRPPRIQGADRHQPAGDRQSHRAAWSKRQRSSRRHDRRRLPDRRRHHDPARRQILPGCTIGAAS